MPSPILWRMERPPAAATSWWPVGAPTMPKCVRMRERCSPLSRWTPQRRADAQARCSQLTVPWSEPATRPPLVAGPCPEGGIVTDARPRACLNGRAAKVCRSSLVGRFSAAAPRSEIWTAAQVAPAWEKTLGRPQATAPCVSPSRSVGGSKTGCVAGLLRAPLANCPPITVVLGSSGFVQGATKGRALCAAVVAAQRLRAHFLHVLRRGPGRGLEAKTPATAPDIARLTLAEVRLKGWSGSRGRMLQAMRRRTGGPKEEGRQTC